MTEHTRPSAFRLNLMFLGSDAEKALFADSFGFVVTCKSAACHVKCDLTKKHLYQSLKCASI